jgi:hypothetical protein
VPRPQTTRPGFETSGSGCQEGRHGKAKKEAPQSRAPRQRKKWDFRCEISRTWKLGLIVLKPGNEEWRKRRKKLDKEEHCSNLSRFEEIGCRQEPAQGDGGERFDAMSANEEGRQEEAPKSE